MTKTTSSAQYAAEPAQGGSASLDEPVRRQGVRPVPSAGDLAQDGVFASDEELDAFLEHVAAERRADSKPDHLCVVLDTEVAAAEPRAPRPPGRS